MKTKFKNYLLAVLFVVLAVSCCLSVTYFTKTARAQSFAEEVDACIEINKCYDLTGYANLSRSKDIAAGIPRQYFSCQRGSNVL